MPDLWRALDSLLLAILAAGGPGEWPPGPAALARCVRELGHPRWETRELAHQRVLDAGLRAGPLLRRELGSRDLERRSRARELVQLLDRRTLALRSYDGWGRATENAVLQGLIWLYRHQDPSGAWTQRGCRGSRCGGAARPQGSPIELTSLSLLAFLGAGYTHQFGEYGSYRFRVGVKQGLLWLIKQQRPDGSFLPPSGGCTVAHQALATLALRKAYDLTHSPLLEDAVARASQVLAVHGLTPADALDVALPHAGDAGRRLVATHAAFRQGGAIWERWKRDLEQSLAPTFVDERGACSDGSWAPDAGGSRVRTTALNLLALEVYYGYSRSLAND